MTKTIIGDDVRGTRVKSKIGAVHQRVFSDMARQNERNFPIGALRTGYLKNIKNNAEETHGNVFYQCVFCHTDVGQNWLVSYLRQNGYNTIHYLKSMILYLPMEQ